MSDIKFSELTTASAIISGDYIAIIRSGSATAAVPGDPPNNYIVESQFFTASYAVSSVSSSIAKTASYAQFNNLFVNGDGQVLGNLVVLGDITSDLSGSLYGTSSWSNNSKTASYISASNLTGTVVSSSYSAISSYSTSGSYAITSSLTTTASFSTNSLNSNTSSYVSNVSMSGDISGSSNNAVVTKIQGFPVTNTSPTIGDVLVYNGTSWAPTTKSLPTFVSSSNLSIPTTNGTVLTFNHGLGKVPTSVRVVIAKTGTSTVKVSEQTYSVGDEIPVGLSTYPGSGGEYQSVVIIADSTKVTIANQWASYPISIGSNKSGTYATSFVLTTADWVIKIYVMAF